MEPSRIADAARDRLAIPQCSRRGCPAHRPRRSWMRRRGCHAWRPARRAAAVTMAAPVEMLSVPLLLLLVPQVSIAPAGASIVSILARMVRTAPVISATVSLRTRSAIRKAPIWVGVDIPRHQYVEGLLGFMLVERPPAGNGGDQRA